MGLGNLELIVLGDVNAVDDVVSRDGNNTKLVEITDLDSNDVLFDVVHISDDDYHIYAHHRTFILVSEPSRDHFRPTTPALKSSDTTVWTFHHKGHSSIGYGIYSVKNKDTDRHFMGQNLEFRSIHDYLGHLITKRNLVLQDYEQRMEEFKNSINKSNATGIPLSEYVSRLAETGLENLRDVNFTGGA